MTFEIYTNKGLNVLFLHIPKNAGVSVVTALGINGPDIANHPKPEFFIREDQDFWNNALKLAVCRNPYTRLVSGYNFMKSSSGVEFPEFEQFVEMIYLDEVNNKAIEPQVEWVSVKGLLVTDQINILRFEYIENDYNNFVQDNNLSQVEPLGKLNSTDNVGKEGYYSDKNIVRMVREIYADDFKTFNYNTKCLL